MKWIILVIIIIIICWVLIHYYNKKIVVTYYNYAHPLLSKQWDGYKILQISDFHNTQFGKKQSKFIHKIHQIAPDCIVITGDLIDRRRFNLDVAMEWINEIRHKYPIYFVSGNHEMWSNQYDIIKKTLKEQGVMILESQNYYVEKGNEKFVITGLEDCSILNEEGEQSKDINRIKESLTSLKENDYFQLVLSHRPELFPLYVNAKVDLVLCGHAHGGQVRLPIIKGLFSPNQGIFPKYAEGKHIEKNTTMIVSRGLGNSVFPYRINNCPELVVIQVESKK